MKNNKHIRKALITMLLMLFISVGTIFGQVGKTAGTRISDSTTEKTLETNAILDLDSTTKGFFLPRMNTAQRAELEAKVKLSGRGNAGLAIYNTDIDCVEYWNARTLKWMSLCGSLPPAKLDIDGDCSSVTVLGMGSTAAPIWQQGKPLDPNVNMIQIKVKVEQIGTYQISANSNNGYFFSTEGQFQAPGYYPLVLKGMGTPVVGYDENTGLPGDKLVFSFNGVESTVCKDLIVAVKPADLKLKIVGGTYKAVGKYFVNVAADASPEKGNSLEITVDVETPGTATISAENAVLGIKFSGTKTFVVGNGQKMLLTPVAGEATPKENGENNYILTFKANTKDQVATINGNTASIVVEKTEISFDKNKVDFGKEPMYQGTALNSKHEVTIPIKVIASGKTNLKLRNAEGVELEAKDVVFNMVSDPNQTQNVVFKLVPNNTVKMPESSTSEFTLTGDGKRFGISGGDKVTFNLGKKPVAYTIDCANIKSNRSAIPYNTAINNSYYIIVPVDVTTAGEYEIYTAGSADGVTFSSSIDGVKQVFSSTGKQEVRLYAVDKTITPKNKGTYSVDIKTNDGAGLSGCGNKFDVKVGFADLNILYYYGDERPVYFSTFINGIDKSTGKKRFGPEGVIVETGEVKITPIKVTHNRDTPSPLTATVRATIAKDIKDGKYNLIVMEGLNILRSLDQDVYDAVLEYVRKDRSFMVVTAAISSSYTDYSEILDNEEPPSWNKNEYVGGFDMKIGTKLFDDLNGAVKIKQGTKVDYKIGMKMVNNQDPFYAGPYKYLTNNLVHFQIQSSSLTIDCNGTKYESIVNSSSNISRSSVMRHKDYRNFVWILGTYNNNTHTIMNRYQFDPTTGEPNIPTAFYPNNNTGAFAANVLTSLIKTAVNK